jgi:hypothetical protein
MNNFALELLVNGKSDKELLEILVAALTENDDACLKRLTEGIDTYSGKREEAQIVNGAIIHSICEEVRPRFDESVSEDTTDGD